MSNTLCASSQGRGCKCCWCRGPQLRGAAVPPPAAWGAARWQQTGSEKVIQLKVEQGELLVAGAAGSWQTARCMDRRMDRRMDQFRFRGFSCCAQPPPPTLFLLCQRPVTPPPSPHLLYIGAVNFLYIDRLPRPPWSCITSRGIMQ